LNENVHGSGGLAVKSAKGGKPMKKKLIRLMGVFAVVVILSFLFAGCEPLVKDPPSANSSEEEDAPTPAETSDDGGDDSDSGSGEVC
jgi:hypothetical protein